MDGSIGLVDSAGRSSYIQTEFSQVGVVGSSAERRIRERSTEGPDPQSRLLRQTFYKGQKKLKAHGVETLPPGYCSHSARQSAGRDADMRTEIVSSSRSFK